ncbi:hypothetical protein [Embleya sp. AB8]|uniref:hypothetical protein n=1 Tax=Embleya sp. AB8 TaxID=3156304 RepID=UPI003C725A0C
MRFESGGFPLVVPQSPLQLWDWDASRSRMVFRRRTQYGIRYEDDRVLDVCFRDVRTAMIEPYVPGAVVRPLDVPPPGEAPVPGHRRAGYFSITGVSALHGGAADHWVLCGSVMWAWLDIGWDDPSPFTNDALMDSLDTVAWRDRVHPPA